MEKLIPIWESGMTLCHQGAAPGRGPEAKVSILLPQFPTDADLHS